MARLLGRKDQVEDTIEMTIDEWAIKFSDWVFGHIQTLYRTILLLAIYSFLINVLLLYIIWVKL